MSNWTASHGLTADEYQARFTELANQGLRLTDVSGYLSNDGKVRYTGIWERAAGPDWRGRHGIPAAQYQQVFNQLHAEGFRPIRLSGYATPTGVEFAGVWIADGVSDWEAHHGLDALSFAQKVAQLADGHLHLIDLTAYEDGGQARFAGIWQRLPGARPLVDIELDRGQFQLRFADMVAQRKPPTKVVGYSVQGTARYAAIWTDAPSRGYHVRHAIDGDEYQRDFDRFYFEGFRLVQVTGYSTSAGERFTMVWQSHYDRQRLALVEDLLRDFCVRYTAPGVSIAISYQGQLKYARAFGFASVWPIEFLTVRHRMRMASVAKVITAAAIMRLVERGQLGLDDLVFGANGRLGTAFGTPAPGANELAITVRHLLNHTAGYTQSPEPAEQQPTIGVTNLIQWMIANMPLGVAPGTALGYSNYHYVVLGKIIEVVSGQTYETYVRNEVMTPAGAASMAVAFDSGRQPDEVIYYPVAGDVSSSALPVRRNAASGGWISTAIDLLRFLRTIDGVGTDLISPSLVTAMATGSTLGPAQGLGWVLMDPDDTPPGVFHHGVLPGSVGYLALDESGRGFAALVNTRPLGDQQTAMLAELSIVRQVIAGLLGIKSSPLDL